MNSVETQASEIQTDDKVVQVKVKNRKISDKKYYEKKKQTKHKTCELCGGTYFDAPSKRALHEFTNKHIFYFENPDRRDPIWLEKSKVPYVKSKIDLDSNEKSED